MSKSSHISRKNSDSYGSLSEDVAESRSHETPATEKQENLISPPTSSPAMKTKTKKSDRREAYTSSASTTYTKNMRDIYSDFKESIYTARQLSEEKAPWDRFTKEIKPDGSLDFYWESTKQGHEFIRWISTSPNLKITTLYINFLAVDMAQDDLTALTKAIKLNTTITKIYFSNATFDTKTLKFLIDATISNPESKINILNLYKCPIDDEGVKVIAEALKTNSNSTITEMGISSCKLCDKGAITITEALITNPKSNIKAIDISNNNISKEGVKAIAKAYLANPNKTIENINLANNNIGEDGANDLIEAFIVNPNSHITELDLSGCLMGLKGIELIAKAIIANPNSNITKFNVNFNTLRDEGDKFIQIIKKQCLLNAQKKSS
ncbi:MAG: hypothetical protein LW714_09745 [Oxalobacteraceae bacterium]|jgi:hypothetical protein|nr:hypothetical protein [Oxalobacteraceae bacterium]